MKKTLLILLVIALYSCEGGTPVMSEDFLIGDWKYVNSYYNTSFLVEIKKGQMTQDGETYVMEIDSIVGNRMYYKLGFEGKRKRDRAAFELISRDTLANFSLIANKLRMDELYIRQ